MQTISYTERAKLIEAALRSPNPQAFLSGLQSAFRHDGRLLDFSITAELCTLFQQGEIEKLLYLRAKWQSEAAIKSQPRSGSDRK